MDLPTPKTTQTKTTGQIAADTTASLEADRPAGVTDGWDPTPRNFEMPQGLGERAREQQGAIPAGHIALQGDNIQPPQPRQ